MPGLYRFVVRFVEKGSRRPLTGPAFKARFYDRDLIRDNRLGESALDAGGSAAVVVSSASFKSLDSPGETRPDVYCVLEKDGQAIFRTPVRANLDLDAADKVTGTQARTIDLGAFEV